jgi:hypothetical protein
VHLRLTSLPRPVSDASVQPSTVRAWASLALMLPTLACRSTPGADAAVEPTLTTTTAAASAVSPTDVALTLTVSDVTGVARVDEISSSGVPLARELGITDPSRLVIVDDAGRALPTQLDVLARWDAPLADTRAPIQWLWVTFPASAPAQGSRRYRLVTDGSAGPAPAPAMALTVSATAERVRVDTGVATFVLDGRQLLSEATVAGAAPLLKRSELGVTLGKKTHGVAAVRRLVVERRGPLTTTVLVEGTTQAPRDGNGGLSFRRRYVFRAGSPTVVVRSTLAWEGERCSYDVLACDGRPNAVRVERWREAFDVDLGPARDVRVVSAFDDTLEGRWAKGGAAQLRQLQREARTEPAAYEARVDGAAPRRGTQATGGVLSVSDTRGALHVALDHLHRMEPQALRVLQDGRVVMDLADDHIWLAARQGTYATLALAVTSPGRTRADVDREVWAPLNHPLRPWPSAAWWASSGAVRPFPVGPLPEGLEGYDPLLQRVLSQTFDRVAEVGLYGLMVWGSFPRYWHAPNSLEVECDDDPTPGETWDDTYWCTTWTDYHNTSYTAAVHAMRTGEVAWVDELMLPAAQRMLHTQILQCAPGDTNPFCGKAAAGYRAFRSDNNSSHQYWESLYLYYWLTGDRTVIDVITPGVQAFRNYACSKRGQGQGACTDGDGPRDEYWSGRIGAQFGLAERFLGLAGDDPSFLDDYRGTVARLLTQRFVLVRAPDSPDEYGFLLDGPPVGAQRQLSAQLWMGSLYDLDLVERLRLDTGDAPVGQPAIAPSRALDAWARTLDVHGGAHAPGGNGSVQGAWSEMLTLEWTMPRVGGTLRDVGHFAETGDPVLYPAGKSCLTALVASSAARTGSPQLRQRAIALTCTTLAGVEREELLLGKIAGLALARLPAAVATMTAQGWRCP